MALYVGLTAADVQRIAHLARIEITPQEATEVRLKLDSIFELIEKMRAVDTTGIVPMAHAQEVVLPLRDDVVTESDQREFYLSVAPAVQDGLYLVPKVVE
jgi:aspartyl-tRNA(Asn)/glutamyl-tRNA(Gln) amidotransferase subunit C